ncbi:hypothetical protein ACOSQ2_019184 [Xanthoceras sorbifolium]
MLAQVGHGKDYKKKYLNIDAGKEPKEKYNLYGFVWALQDVVHERLEPSDIELTQSHYEGLMDITDLFPQNTAIPGGGRTNDADEFYAFGAPFFVIGHNCTRFHAPAASSSFPAKDKLNEFEQKLMDVDAQLQAFINESRETVKRRDEQYDLIMS